MRKLLTICSLFAAIILSCAAQSHDKEQPKTTTNTQATTNAPISLEERKKQFLLAMNSVFNMEYDPVDQETVITLKNQQYAGGGLRIGLLCVVSKIKPIPDEISVRFSSRSDDWEYLRNSDFTARWDETKKSFGTLKHDGSVLDNGEVVEYMWADFTLTDFKSAAFSKAINARLGSTAFDIPNDNRATWRLLSKYFDLLKEEQDAAVSKALGE